MAKRRSSSGESRDDRLAKVRKKLANTDMGGGRDFWKPKSGRNVIRILPGVGEMGEIFWQDVGTHYIPQQRKNYTCPKFTLDEECPICEFVGQLYDAGDDDSKELAGALRVRKSYWMNIIVRGSEDRGPLIYRPGVTVFREVAALVDDPDYGDIWDPDDGLDITITRSGDGIDTEYSVMPRRKASPLGTEEQIGQWLEAAKDLYPVILTEDPDEDSDNKPEDCIVFVLPYDRIKSEFEQLDVEVEESEDEEELDPFPEDDDEDEDEEDDKEAIRAALKRSRKSRRRR